MKVCPACGTEYGDEAAFCSRDRSPLRPVTPGAAQGLLGQLVGDRYQVLSRLGEGGMGEVYLATHVMIGRRCALKVMSPTLSKDPDAVSRFNREATNASRISHPNVCAVYDFGLTPDGLVYLAMEYVEGRTLTAVAEAQGPMPVAAATELVAQCADGLEAAHDLGIVHRDLKPDNIMVVSRGGRETVKLVDFGIAKAMEADPAQRVTKTGFVVGTPEYMSPEQIAGDQLDGRSDQYALALVLYRLITGRLPFEGGSIQETLVKRLTDPPRALLISRPEGKFPDGLQAVVDRALARYPGDRYPTIAAFVQALREVVKSGGPPTRRLGAPDPRAGGGIPATRRLPGGTPHRRSKAGLAALGLAVVALGTWGVARFARSPSAAPPGAPPAPDTSHKVAAAVPESAPVTPPAPVPVPPPAPPTTKEVGPVTAAAPTVIRDPSGSPDTSTSSVQGGDSLALPEPGHFDSPARRVFALGRARRIMDAARQPRQKRAVAAALLAYDALQHQDRQTALRLYTFANQLFPRPSYQTMIRQLRDSTP